MFPFKVHCKVRVEQYGWHDDLLVPGTSRHNALANDIISNVSGLKIRTKRFCHNANPVLLFECLEELHEYLSSCRVVISIVRRHENRTGLDFCSHIRKGGFGAISVTGQSCAIPISKVESHISDRCS